MKELDSSTKIMLTVMRSFPSLRRFADHHERLGRFNLEVFWNDVCSANLGSGGNYAAVFMVCLWQGRSIPDPTSSVITHHGFDVIRALGAWDAAHREAFARWVEQPIVP